MSRAILTYFLACLSLAQGEELVPEGDFQSGSLEKWESFNPDAPPNVSRTVTGTLRGEGSKHGGLVALSRWFHKPQGRLKIEFSLAVSQGPGRVFHIWTQEPGGKDASQLNLCVQGGKLQQFDGRTRTWKTVPGCRIEPSSDQSKPVWHRIRAVVDSRSGAVALWVSEPGDTELPAAPTATMASYRTDLPIGGISFVSGTRIAEKAWYQIDSLSVQNGDEIAAPGDPQPLPRPFQLWSGPPIPSDPGKVPFATGIKHHLVHRPGETDDKFLHGAAIIEHDGVLYANWANSPTNENGPHESLRGRRSSDGGKSWEPLEIVAPGFDGPDRHSHGVLLVHGGRVWTICARFGIGDSGKLFPGLKGEAFVLEPETDRWVSRGIVIENCWPYDEPVKMGNGSFITGGQDRDGLPVVAISQGDRLDKKWETVHIPYPPQLSPRFAETTVWADGHEVIAVIRGGGGSAWVATSSDFGKSWSEAQKSNLPMPRSKAILGRLSTGQLYMVSNLRDRNTLVISVGAPGETTLNRMFRLRHGKSEAPRFKGRAKSPQWSYPNAFEFGDHLYVVYSIGKEDCGLTVVPISSLR